MSKRNNAFDLLCGLCILRMVLLHAMCTTQSERAAWWRETMAWTFFFMCFFFFKAGFFNKGVSGPTRPYLRDRTRRLLVPYVSWALIGGLLTFGWHCLYPGGLDRALETVREYRFWLAGLTYGNAPLWFLLSFFLTYVVAHLLERVPHLHWVVLLFPLAGYWLFLHGNPLWLYMNNVLCGTFFFYLGRAWHGVSSRLTRHRLLLLSLLLCVGFVVANIYIHGEYKMRPNVWVGPFSHSMLIIILALWGISGVLLALPTPRIPLLSYVGEHSMVYFVMHYPLILSYAYLCGLVGHDIRGSLPDVGLMMVLAFSLCTLAVPWVERRPCLSGRWTASGSSLKEDKTGGQPAIYFYHTQDVGRIVQEWQQGCFPSHFLYGVLEMQDAGVRVVFHQQKHTYKRWRDTVTATWKVLTCRASYDVLYATHSLGIEPVVMLRALRLYRHPIVVWHHQPVVPARNPLREALARLFYRGMDHMIFFSEKLMADSLSSPKADPKRMSMVHWGADLEYYDKLKASPLPASPRGEETRLGSHSSGGDGERAGASFISTGKELRDYETLLQAFRETGLPLTLFAERKRQAYFEGLHPAENVEMHYGDRPIPHEIAGWVAASRCVCICCQRSNYTVGLTTLVEALALGLPVLCTRNPQMPMDIEAEGCGCWIEVGDVEGWKAKLRFIADHPAEAEAMGRRGRALAEATYNARQCGREVLDIILKCYDKR